MYLFGIIITVIGVSVAQDNQDAEVFNFITVPPNCREGQELVKGKCHEIWRINQNAADLGVIIPTLFNNRNVVTVPPNCPPGQQLINGVCRDVWRMFAPSTPLSKQFEYPDVDQRNRRQTEEDIEVVNMLEVPDLINRNIINIPNQCPVGYKPDAFGFCRRILA